jgi:hypothetical protein
VVQIGVAIAALCILVSTGCTGLHQEDRSSLEHSRFVDLTHSFGSDTIV